jgi:hypothetical protein
LDLRAPPVILRADVALNSAVSGTFSDVTLNVCAFNVCAFNVFTRTISSTISVPPTILISLVSILTSWLTSFVFIWDIKTSDVAVLLSAPPRILTGELTVSHSLTPLDTVDVRTSCKSDFAYKFELI